MRIDEKGVLYTDNVDIYEVGFIIIDESEKSIDVCADDGFSIGKIMYENENKIGIIKYDNKTKCFSGDNVIIFQNGKLVYKKD